MTYVHVSNVKDKLIQQFPYSSILNDDRHVSHKVTFLIMNKIKFYITVMQENGIIMEISKMIAFWV